MPWSGNSIRFLRFEFFKYFPVKWHVQLQPYDPGISEKNREAQDQQNRVSKYQHVEIPPGEQTQYHQAHSGKKNRDHVRHVHGSPVKTCFRKKGDTANRAVSRHFRNVCQRIGIFIDKHITMVAVRTLRVCKRVPVACFVLRHVLNEVFCRVYQIAAKQQKLNHILGDWSHTVC